MAIECILDGTYSLNSHWSSKWRSMTTVPLGYYVVPDAGSSYSYGAIAFTIPDNIDNLQEYENIGIVIQAKARPYTTIQDTVGNKAVICGLFKYDEYFDRYGDIEFEDMGFDSSFESDNDIIIKKFSDILYCEGKTSYLNNFISIDWFNDLKLKPNIKYVLVLYPSDGSLVGVNIEVSSVILYNKYHIRYNLNGGYGDLPDSIFLKDGESFNISQTAFFRNNDTIVSSFNIVGNSNCNLTNTKIMATKETEISYDFLGWSEDPDAINPAYTRGEYVAADHDMILYATWKRTELSVVYENNSISYLDTPIRDDDIHTNTVTLIDTLNNAESTLTSDAITRYQFKGWSINSDSTEILPNDTQFTEESAVYAIWDSYTTYGNIDLPILDKLPYIKEISVGLNTNLGIVSNNKLIAIEETVYSHIGWSLEKDFSEYIEFVNNSYSPTKDTVLYAHWSQNLTKYPVELPIPTKAGNEFLGWGVENDSNSNNFVTSPYMPENNIILHAIWKVINNVIAQMYIYHDGKWYHIFDYNK